MQTPSVHYDEDADVLYVQLHDGLVEKSVNLTDLCIIDYSADGEVLGIEFISAHDGVNLSNIPFRPTVEEAIGDSGLKIRLFA